MKNIKIKCPAKINLTLEVLNKRPDGYHNIKSVMQTISLYDYLNISVKKSEHAFENKIILKGNSKDLPYDTSNLVFKAAELYMQESNLSGNEIEIYIEKNIPIAAGLAGGSTDAAGTIYGLNKIFNILKSDKINELCAKLGSDLNVCLNGGCILATSRGEITEPLTCVNSDVTLIKPKELGISAGFAYKMFSKKHLQRPENITEKLISSLSSGEINKKYLYNDLENAVFDEFKELQVIKKEFPNAIMSGSGSTYFMLENIKHNPLSEKYMIINGLKFVNNGVLED